MDYLLEILLGLIFFSVLVILLQNLIDRSIKQFKEIEYETKIKELEHRIERLEKQNK